MIINTYVIVQNSRTLSLAIKPVIEVSFTKQGAIVQNTGLSPVVDVEATPVIYLVRREPKPYKIVDRRMGESFKRAYLTPKEELRIPGLVISFDVGQPPGFDGYPIRALVVVFRRQVDYKRFVTIEPFIGTRARESYVFAPLYASPAFLTSGPPFEADILKQIEDLERVLFRIGDS
jgi:hypothetical protein